MANVVLDIAGSPMKLIGAGTHTSINTKAHLCRTNVSVIRRIFAEIKYNENIVINTNIELKELFSKLYHINAVYFGQVPKFPNKTLKDLLTKDALEEALAASDDLKQLQKIGLEIASNSNGSLFTGIKKMQEHIVNDGSGSLTVSTIHRSKGLEYSEVTIDNDFLKLTCGEDGDYLDLRGKLEELRNDNARLCMLYVAITRAKVTCNLPEYLTDLF
jgi:superfamily I DNA/RNA helicase